MRRRVTLGQGMEALEPRQLLAANPILTEFMASNRGMLEDGDGNSPDWIELYNAGDTAVDLAGYRLTDKVDDLARWVFPSAVLNAGEYLVVFASGQKTDNYQDPDGYLHTNFSLKSAGEYLALVSPDGTVLSEFGSAEVTYPRQRSNVSFGVAQQTTLIDAHHDATYFVPLDESVDGVWTQLDFDDVAGGFQQGTSALGYETQPSTRSSFAGEILTSLPPRTHAVYVRQQFTLEDPSLVSGLTLGMKYDDGFIAYLNGVKVAEGNAPSNPQWFSSASDNPRRDSAALEFVEFDLSNDLDQLVSGTNVLAIHGLNRLADSDMLLVPELIAVVSHASLPIGYMPAPTPGAPNVSDAEIFSGFVADVRINAPRGYYDAPFDAVLTTDTPAAVIRYTTDGSVPTPTSGTAYEGPISIDTTTTLRAAAFKQDFVAGNVTTQTYLFLGDVIRQPNNPPRFPRTWDGMAQAPIPADYEMDPEVVNDPAYRDEILEGLRSIPSMSLVMDPADLFGSEQGIYVNSGQRGDQWEKATSVEIIEPDGSSFQTDSGIKIHGFSWRFHSNTPKHSFRLEFSEAYGPRKLEYKLFPDAPVDRFDSIVLRAQGGRAWAGLQVPNQTQYIRDAFARDTARDMGKVDGHAAFLHLYLNGLYWGLYHAVERPDAQMGEEYFGGSDEDYDALNRRTVTNEAIDGDLDRYNEMLRFADQGLATPEAYAEIQRFVDLDNLIDFFLIHQYTTNQDGPETFQSNNQRAIGSRVGDPKFRFFVWDMEYSIWNANQEFNFDVNIPGSISRVYTKLRENPEFRMRYADRAHQNLFHGGPLTPLAAAARWETRAEEIYTAIIAESARWGDAKRAKPFTRDVEWQRERERLLSEYFPQRTGFMIDQLRAADLYPDVDAPVFRQHGGPVPIGYELAMSNPGRTGTIVYSIDGTDPRLPGGGVAPEARIYDGRPISVLDNVTVKARVLAGREWSALNQAHFFLAGPDSPHNLRVSEINFNPHAPNPVAGLDEDHSDRDQFEFLELTNTGPQEIDLGGVQISRAVDFTFASDTRLGPGDFVLVVMNQAAFESRYGRGLNVAGQFAVGQFSDAGELLDMRDREGHLIQRIKYDDGDDWPQRADGGGSSLEVIDPLGGAEKATDWRSSSQFGGSPGSLGRGPDERIEITEVLAHATATVGRMVELHNTTGNRIDISNWYISNTADNYFQSQITLPTSVAPRGYAVLDESQLGFDFNWWQGDNVWLIEADTRGKPLRFADHVEFGPSGEGISMGPGPEETAVWRPLAEQTFGRENTGTRAGDVIISEVHYAPVDPDGSRRQFKPEQFEFVELYNRTEHTVELTNWRLTGGIEITIPPGTVIDARQTLVVVPFDVTDAVKASIFRVTLGVNPSVAMVGPYIGDLDDSGELVRLERPEPPPPQLPDFLPYLFVDEVRYNAASPWPADIVGSGDSLHRSAPGHFGNFAASWTAGVASPGTVDFVLRTPGDANEDGQFNQLDIVRVLQAGKFLADESAVWDEGDWNDDGRFNQLDVVAALQSGKYLQGPNSARGVLH